MSVPIRAHVAFWRDAQLPMIEGRKAMGSYARYRAHTHPTLSVGIVDEGQSSLRLGHRAISLRAGDVIVLAPGQAHACNPQTDRSWSYRMFYLDAVWTRQFVDDLGSDRAWPYGVLSDPAAGRLVDGMEGALRTNGEAGRRRATIGRCLRDLLRRCPEIYSPRDAGSEAANLRAIRDYLDSHCAERIPLAHLCGMTGLSPFRLIRLFRREYGLTPHAYQLDCRINRARTLLRRGHSLADLAYLTGFTDQSHFQRAFKLRVAATPFQYRSSPAVKSGSRR